MSTHTHGWTFYRRMFMATEMPVNRGVREDNTRSWAGEKRVLYARGICPSAEVAVVDSPLFAKVRTSYYLPEESNTNCSEITCRRRIPHSFNSQEEMRNIFRRLRSQRTEHVDSYRNHPNLKGSTRKIGQGELDRVVILHLLFRQH